MKEWFDCRKHIRPGDVIRCHSMKACDTYDQVLRSGTIQTDALVLGVYESFVMVKLKRVTECINRWDIIKINGRPVGNKIGLLGRRPKYA